jgi:acylpyruvate hydrolase
MRVATVRVGGQTRAALIREGRLGILGQPDVGTVLDEGHVGPVLRWRRVGDAAFEPIVPRPRKIICLGLNYTGHIREMGREMPEHPTMFAKFAPALIGANDPIVLPAASEQLDWEAELALVIGRPARHLDPVAALDAIAGYTVMNDISARDWQRRTTQWLQGKTFESTTPIGPVLVTTDEIGEHPDMRIRCWVNDELMQDARTGDLVFDPATIVSYVSQILTLEPGDVIATGTPSGVGAARDPARFLRPGDVVRTSIEGIGELVNTCVDGAP